MATQKDHDRITFLLDLLMKADDTIKVEKEKQYRYKEIARDTLVAMEKAVNARCSGKGQSADLYREEQLLKEICKLKKKKYSDAQAQQILNDVLDPKQVAKCLDEDSKRYEHGTKRIEQIWDEFNERMNKVR